MSSSRVAEISGPHAGLLDWLAGHGVEYELREHPRTFTALETARAEGVDPRRFAKTVAVETASAARALLVVDAADRVDLGMAAIALDTPAVRLLSEAEMTALLPDCEVGTLPPVGDLVGVPVVADLAIHDDPEIAFHAGSHRFTVHVERAGWERAAHVRYADLVARGDRAPAWAGS